MEDLLPSLKFFGDDPRPVGFVLEPDQAHVDAASAALGELGELFKPGDGTARELHLCLCSARYVPALPFALYSFHIVSFGANGEPIDEIAEGVELLYAFVINHPVEVQREAALLFLYDMVFRQEALGAPDAQANQADIIAARASEQAHAEFRDRIRAGWHEAARSLNARARHAGLALHVTHRLDPFPERDAVIRRMPALRQTYNSIPLAREFIDKVVSLVGGHDPRIVAPGAPEEIRTFVQRKLVELGMRHYTTQTIRDAEVLGNGYFVMPAQADTGPYNLRPEDVEVLGPSRFAVRRGDTYEELDTPVLHARGVEQFQSLYGFSVLEAVLPEWVTRRTLANITRETEELVTRIGVDSERRQYLEEVRSLAARHQQASDDRLSRLLWYPREWVPEAVEGLYFPGQEKM